MSSDSIGPGTRLGSYEVLSTLGAGGMGTVYRAQDTKLGRDVAIKVLLPEPNGAPVLPSNQIVVVQRWFENLKRLVLRPPWSTREL